MHSIKKFVYGLGLAAALTAGTTSVANADDRGDGNLACNNGEICFSQHANGTGGQRHFWGDANHSYAGNFHNGVRFWHAASSIWNRDTACGVVVRESGDVFNDSFYYGRYDGWWVNFGGDLNDQNASHQRCVMK